jgi:integrase
MLYLLKGCPNKRFAIAVRLSLATGMRRGEVCGLRWCDVDFMSGEIHIEHSLSEVSSAESQTGETLELKGPKTLESDRRISLDEDTLKVLQQYYKELHYLLAYNDYELTKDTPVFADQFGKWYRPSILDKDFVAFRNKHGFNIRFHLRHTHASILIKNGVDITTIANRLGHADPSITYKIYAHMMPGTDKAAAEKIGEIFSGVLPDSDELLDGNEKISVPELSQTVDSTVPNKTSQRKQGSDLQFSGGPSGTRTPYSAPSAS